MRLLALVLVALVAGCSSGASVPVPTFAELRETAVRLEFGGGVVCSGVAIAPDKLATATHCFSQGPLLKVNDRPVTVVSVEDDKRDHAIVTLAAPTFERWAKRGQPMKAGDRVRWWGQPRGEAFVYREAIVAKIGEGYVYIDGTICHGDSGAGLMNDAGELVGSITGMTDENGCTFMGVLQ